MRRQKRARIVAYIDGLTESFGNAIGSDIIMGRANATAGEHMLEAIRQSTHCGHYRASIIADHAHLAQINAMCCEFFGEMIGIGIQSATREDFITDHQHGGCGVGHLRLSLMGV